MPTPGATSWEEALPPPGKPLLLLSSRGPVAADGFESECTLADGRSRRSTRRAGWLLLLVSLVTEAAHCSLAASNT